MGVNFWGVVHGCRAFLPHLVGGGHIVNTASIAGLYPGLRPVLRRVQARRRGDHRGPLQHRHGGRAADRRQRAVPRLGAHAASSRPTATGRAELGEKPADDPANDVVPRTTSTQALAEGRTPASVADAVADAITADRFWVIPHQDFLDLVHRALGDDRRARRPGAGRARARHAAALADPRRGRRRARACAARRTDAP